MNTNVNDTLAVDEQQNTGMSFADVISKFSTPKKKREVSLSNLTEQQIAKIMKSADNGLKLARQYSRATVEKEVTRRTQIFNSDDKYYKSKFPRLSEKTTWRSRDVQTAAEWMMPSLLEAFTSGDEPVDIKGVDVNDDVKAKQLQQIISYQIMRKNDLYGFLTFAFREAFRSNFGIGKVWWKHEEERERYGLLISEDDIATALALGAEAKTGAVEIKSVKRLDEAPDLIRVTYDKVKVTANHPVLEFLSPSELLFTPEATNLQETKFVAHRKIVTGDYLKRKEQEGIYKNVEQAIKVAGNIAPTEHESEMNKELSNMRSQNGNLSDQDNASTYVELIEAYIDVDYNNDGISERMIVHMVENVPLRISVNEFEFVPFFPCCIEYSPNKVFSEYSFSDLIEQQQDLKTALIKQMIINVAQQNAGQKMFDPNAIDIDALIDGDEFVAVNTEGGNSVNDYIYAVATPALSPVTMELIQYTQNEIESQTGSTRYNQGNHSESLNKTARGISMIMSAADKRIHLIARSIAEHFYVPIIKAVILLNQKYLTENEIIRLNNENISIRKEDLDINYDLVINVGEGAGTKESRIEYLMVLLQQLMPLLAQAGIANDNTIYNVTKDLLQEMGMRSTLAFLQDPQSEEAQRAKAQALQAQQQAIALEQQAKAQEQQTELLKAVLPKISIKYEDLPIGSKQQLLNIIGLGADTGELIAKELFDDTKNSTKPNVPPKENNIRPGKPQGGTQKEASGSGGAGKQGRDNQ